MTKLDSYIEKLVKRIDPDISITTSPSFNRHSYGVKFKKGGYVLAEEYFSSEIVDDSNLDDPSQNSHPAVRECREAIDRIIHMALKRKDVIMDRFIQQKQEAGFYFLERFTSNSGKKLYIFYQNLEPRGRYREVLFLALPRDASIEEGITIGFRVAQRPPSGFDSNELPRLLVEVGLEKFKEELDKDDSYRDIKGRAIDLRAELKGAKLTTKGVEFPPRTEEFSRVERGILELLEKHLGIKKLSEEELIDEIFCADSLLIETLKYLKDQGFVKGEDTYQITSQGRDYLGELRATEIAKSQDKLVLQLMSELDTVNALFKRTYHINLIVVQEQRVWKDLLKPCKTEDDFNNLISCLSSLIDWINIEGIKGLIQNLPDPGSINFLEAFLKEKHPSYDPNIIKRLRRIKTIRKKYPIHKDSPEVIKAFKEIGDYPPTDWQQFWDRILTDFLLSLVQIRECL